MKKFLKISLALAAIVFVSAALAANDQPTVGKTFTVSPGGDLTVASDTGSIQVKTGSQDEVVVTVERSAKGASSSELAGMLKRNHVTTSLDGNHVSVEVRNDKVPHGWFSPSHGQLDVVIKVMLPRRFNADLATGGGNIQVADLEGTVNSRSAGGNLDFLNIKGVVDGNTSGGNLQATGCSEKMTLQTSGGNVAIQDFSGPQLQIDTSGGNIRVRNCSGALQAKTSGGNITVEKFSGPKTFLDTSGGMVLADFEKPPAAECWFRSSGGNLTLKLPADIAATLNSATDGGQIICELPVTVHGRVTDGKLDGKINGGGPLLVLNTSGGDISILKR